MRSRGLWMLLIAAVAGLAAVALAARWMQTAGGEQGRIAVANTDIEWGGRISSEMVRMTEWPKDSVPQGAFHDASRLQGRVALVGLQRGEPLTEARLAPVGSKGGLSAVVPEGRRAMTVRVNDVVGVAGFALPGTYVDVMVNTQAEGATIGQRADRSISKIVLERILVLAVAQEADRDATKPKVVNAVTLEVTPRDAEVLDLARSVGTLSLVLRNAADPLRTASLGVTKSELLSGLNNEPAVQKAPTAARPAAKAPTQRTRTTQAPPVAALTERDAASAPRPPHPLQAPARPTALAAVASPDQRCVEIVRGLAKTTECF